MELSGIVEIQGGIDEWYIMDKWEDICWLV